MFNEHTRISDIVRLYHQSAAVFEKYGIDFCCKGKRPLAEACIEKGIDQNALMNEIRHGIRDNDELPSFNFSAWSPALLTEYIVEQHHSFVRSNSPLILQHSARVAERHGDHQPQTLEIAAIVARVVADLSEHMEKEEQLLFPAIRKFREKNIPADDKKSIEQLIESCDSEHRDAGLAFERIRVLTNNYTPPANACTTFRLLYAELDAFEKDLHRHVHLENNVLFPKILEGEEALNILTMA